MNGTAPTVRDHADRWSNRIDPLFDEVVWTANGEGLLSAEHFSVDRTLIEAAASLTSFRLKEGPTAAIHG